MASSSFNLICPSRFFQGFCTSPVALGTLKIQGASAMRRGADTSSPVTWLKLHLIMAGFLLKSSNYDFIIIIIIIFIVIIIYFKTSNKTIKKKTSTTVLLAKREANSKSVEKNRLSAPPVHQGWLDQGCAIASQNHRSSLRTSVHSASYVQQKYKKM